jgi:hypothetical protein
MSSAIARTLVGAVGKSAVVAAGAYTQVSHSLTYLQLIDVVPCASFASK